MIYTTFAPAARQSFTFRSISAGVFPGASTSTAGSGTTANTRSIRIVLPVNRSQLMNDTSDPRTVFLTDLERAVGVVNHTQRMVLAIPA